MGGVSLSSAVVLRVRATSIHHRELQGKDQRQTARDLEMRSKVNRPVAGSRSPHPAHRLAGLDVGRHAGVSVCGYRRGLDMGLMWVSS